MPAPRSWPRRLATMLDREQHDQHAGDHQRDVVDAVGTPSMGFMSRSTWRRPRSSRRLGHQRAEQADQRVDQQLDGAPVLGQQRRHRFKADVPGVAHADRQAEGGDEQHQQQRQRLRPRWACRSSRNGRRPATSHAQDHRIRPTSAAASATARQRPAFEQCLAHREARRRPAARRTGGAARHGRAAAPGPSGVPMS